MGNISGHSGREIDGPKKKGPEVEGKSNPEEKNGR